MSDPAERALEFLLVGQILPVGLTPPETLLNPNFVSYKCIAKNVWLFFEISKCKIINLNQKNPFQIESECSPCHIFPKAKVAANKNAQNF